MVNFVVYSRSICFSRIIGTFLCCVVFFMFLGNYFFCSVY